MDFNLSIYHYCVGRFSCCRKYYNIHETCCQHKRNVKSVCHGYVLHPHKRNPKIYTMLIKQQRSILHCVNSSFNSRISIKSYLLSFSRNHSKRTLLDIFIMVSGFLYFSNTHRWSLKNERVKSMKDETRICVIFSPIFVYLRFVRFRPFKIDWWTLSRISISGFLCLLIDRHNTKERMKENWWAII